MLYKASKVISISISSKEIWTITTHTWKHKLNGSIGKEIWWIRSWNNLLSSRMPSVIKNEASTEWPMTTKALVESDKTTTSKSKNKQGLKSTNASSKTDTRTKFIVQIAKSLSSRSSWSCETLQTWGSGTTTRNNTSRGRSSRPGSWTTSSWRCSRMNRVTSSSWMTRRISTRIRRGFKLYIIKKWRILNWTRGRISSSSIKICLTNNLKSRIPLKCMVTWVQLRKISIKSIWMPSRITIRDSIRWCQGCSTPSMSRALGRWQPVESRCWVQQAQQVARGLWNMRSVTIWSRPSSSKLATTIEDRGTSPENPLEIRKTELEAPKCLWLHSSDIAIRLLLVITISQPETGLCHQLTSTKSKPQYKAEEQVAPKLILPLQLEEAEAEPNTCKETLQLQTYITHLEMPYLDRDHNRLTAAEVPGLLIRGLQASSSQWCQLGCSSMDHSTDAMGSLN